MNEDTYIRFVQSEVSQKGFAQFFRQLLALPEDKSVLWHCTGGKDRAGTAAITIAGVIGAWMRRMIQYLKEEYGSVVHYIEEVLHASKQDMETLQKMYLQ